MTVDASSLKIPVEAGIPRWSRAAVDLLTETATEYDRVLTTNEFAEEVQRRAGAWANVTSKTWVRKVLGVVTLKCVKEGWPHLASLVVRPSDGKPGPWYFDVLAETGPGSAQDESHHAARQRLDCYEHFGADVPDGADPTLDPLRRRRTVRHLDAKPAPTRSAKTKATPPARTRPAAARKPQAPSEERRGKVCPTCFMEMPLSGVCANCA